MDPRILDWGNALTRCRYREQCPGVLGKTVVNDPGAGIPPRGLFIRPADAALDRVSLVVLGLNPGRADEPEKAILRQAFLRDPARLFEAVHDETIGNIGRWDYWVSIDRLLKALELNRGVVLALECVFCECCAGLTHPGEDTLEFCSAKHLGQWAAQVPSTAAWLCVGDEARIWFERSGLSGSRAWAWTSHASGARDGSFEAMFGPGGALLQSVRDDWSRALSGSARGICLSPADRNLSATFVARPDLAAVCERHGLQRDEHPRWDKFYRPGRRGRGTPCLKIESKQRRWKVYLVNFTHTLGQPSDSRWPTDRQQLNLEQDQAAVLRDLDTIASELASGKIGG